MHERFTAAEIEQLRIEHPDAMIITHPECPPEVLKAADFAGSTGAMAAFVRDHKPGKAILITECSMSDNVAVENPDTQFVRPCNLCPHMKRISLAGIYDALRLGQHEVHVRPEIAEAARASVQAMLDLPSLDKPPAFDTSRAAVDIPYVQA